MPPVKRIIDLTDYTTVLPYSSEMFGVYQPLLGWKSKRIEDRFNQGFESDKNSILEKLKNEFAGLVDIEYNVDNFPDKIEIKPGVLATGKIRSFDSILLHHVSLKLPIYEDYTPSIWPDLITPDFLDDILKTKVVDAYRDIFGRVIHSPNVPRTKLGTFEHQLQYESAIAGALLFLVQEKSFDALRDIFYSIIDNKEKAVELIY